MSIRRKYENTVGAIKYPKYKGNCKHPLASQVAHRTERGIGRGEGRKCTLCGAVWRGRAGWCAR
jgi:hypothetical protein